jgi:hypothetical protein
MGQLFTQTYTNQTTSWVMHSWSTFSAWTSHGHTRTSHGHTRTHKTHHGPNSKEATTFALIVFFVINHGGYIQMSFCPRTSKLGIPKFPKLGLKTPGILEGHNFLCKPLIEMRSKEKL